jgi:hypothetical protein
MDHKGLLFIPDISGFTRFVTESEIEHSRLIIQELLEILINANHLGLEISEIEGDAILFYKFGEPPPLPDLYKQVEDMFCAFHRYLMAYDRSRYCYCAACNAAIRLTLKVITHYGEFADYHVKNFNKLIGKDVIVAHQLLKNDIEQHEYWLVTPTLVHGEPPAGITQWMHWMSSSKQTETGPIPFHYALLSRLKEQLPPEPAPAISFSDKVKIMSASAEYETGIISLFHATGDFNFRSRWQEGVQKVEQIDHLLPRVGMRCRCIMENGETMIYSSSYYYHPERIQFTETDEKTNNTTLFVLEKLNENRTRLTLEFYMKKNFINQLLFNITEKKKMTHSVQRSLSNLETLLKEMNSPLCN